MSNKTDTLHRINRHESNIKELMSAIFDISTRQPFAAAILRENLAEERNSLREAKHLAERMGWL